MTRAGGVQPRRSLLFSEGLVVERLVGVFLGHWGVFVHQERLAAMDKGIPLPELPLDPVQLPRQPDPKATLVHGIVWTAMGVGAMAALWLVGPVQNQAVIWPLPLPLALLGFGLILYYALASERAR